MKKLSVFCVLSALIFILGSCGNKSQKVPFDNGDSAYSAKADPTLFGVCGVDQETCHPHHTGRDRS